MHCSCIFSLYAYVFCGIFAMFQLCYRCRRSVDIMSRERYNEPVIKLPEISPSPPDVRGNPPSVAVLTNLTRPAVGAAVVGSVFYSTAKPTPAYPAESVFME